MIYRIFHPGSVARAFPRKSPRPFWVWVVIVVGLAASARTAGAADSIFYRLFLRDGTSIVSYGEFARVADRVVVSIPVGDPAASSSLQLISIPDASVDWERTDRYSDAVRAKRYGET